MKKLDNSTSRSDQLRKQRTQQSFEQSQKAVRNVYRPVKPKPVVIRGGYGAASTARPIHESARGKVRRQMYYKLGANGAEISLPSIPLLKPGWRMVSGTMVAILAVMLYFLLSSPFFKVSELQTSGMERLNADILLAVLDIKDIPVVQIDRNKLEYQLERSFPELSEIHVSVGIPANVTVSAKERIPVISWEYGENIYWIDADGTILPPRGAMAENMVIIHSEDSEPPVIAGTDLTESEPNEADSSNTLSVTDQIQTDSVIYGKKMDTNLVKAILSLPKMLQEGSTILYNSKDGLGWYDARGWNVFIGLKLDNFELKLVEYEAIVNELNRQGIQPSVISVEFLNAPFYRVE